MERKHTRRRYLRQGRTIVELSRCHSLRLFVRKNDRARSRLNQWSVVNSTLGTRYGFWRRWWRRRGNGLRLRLRYLNRKGVSENTFGEDNVCEVAKQRTWQSVGSTVCEKGNVDWERAEWWYQQIIKNLEQRQKIRSRTKDMNWRTHQKWNCRPEAISGGALGYQRQALLERLLQGQ